MPAARRNKTWKQEQKNQFGERLKWAQTRAGFRHSAEVIRQLDGISPRAGRTYYSHVRGEKVPNDDAIISIYCDIFKISRDFLLFGNGPELEEYAQGENSTSEGLVNLEESQNKVNASQFQPVRYIPILRATDIEPFLIGTGGAAIMAGDTLPVARQFVAGPRPYAFNLPENDRSMIGTGTNSFPPETTLSIDPDRAIMPDDFALVWPAGWPEPTLRQVKSKWPLLPTGPRYPFDLIALNPEFETLTVLGENECKIFGRLIGAHQRF